MVEEGEYKLALPRYENLASIVKDDYRRVTFKIEAAELKIRLNVRQQGISDLETLLADLNPTGWLFRDVRRRIEDIFLRSGDQDGLVSYYQKWIENNPEDVGAIARLARFLASSARVEEASKWMEKALTLAPKRTDLRKSFIDQLVNDQRYAEASNQYALLVKSSPGNPDFLRDWGKLVMKDRGVEKSKRREQAVKIWSRIIEARPDDALTQAQVADLYRHSDLESEAIERYEKAIELAPAEPQYREYLGEYFHILKRPEDALKTWESIAEGKRNTAENVARLAEVYNSFGYLPQAVEKISAACELDPKEFALQLRSAQYHMRHEKFDEALAYNKAANSLSASEEESELVLRNRIEIFQTNRKLEDEIDRLRDEVEESAEPTVEAWHTLARYLEANRNWPDAMESLEKALEINDKSIPVLTSSARVAETSGDYARAAAENRKLASIDRRLRSEHLMNVARLEAQLGNRDEALAAAKELIVSAPGNTDNYQFYSQLCYRLGETEMALDALRKAVRLNPTEASLTIALGKTLAEEFRTDEAIEVYWRAFEKSQEIDDQTSLVQKLTPLYEQQNQFDKLLERLERDRREESKRREMTICLAQVHNTAGDYGTARRELESLLSDDTRDTNLLQQLSKLCESGSDFDAAVAYQSQLAKVAPGHESEFRLAKLLFSSGKRDAASEIFVKLTAREEDPVRLLKSIDGLLKRSDFTSVVKITEPLLSESRDDWELLYREGVALAKQDKTDVAKLRFERILSLNFPHEKMGVTAAQKFKRASQKSKSNNNQGIRSKIPDRQSAFQLARSATSSIKQATGTTHQNYYYGNNQLPPVWTPSHYGVARMAAYSWLTKFESDVEVEKDVAADDVDLDEDEDEDEEEATSFTDAVVELGEQEDADQNQILNWLYVESLRGNQNRIFEISRRMAIGGGKAEQKFFLASLPMRNIDAKNMRDGSRKDMPDAEPLSEADVELMLKCFKETSEKDDGFGAVQGSGQVFFSGGQMYVRVGNVWQPYGNGNGSLAQVAKELKLAGRSELAEQMINEKIDAAQKPAELVQAMMMMISEKKLGRIDDFLTKWKSAALEEIELAPIKVSRRSKSSNKHSANQAAGMVGVVRKLTGPLAAEEENAKVLAVINDVLDVEIKERLKRRQQAKASRRKSSSRRQYYDRRITYQYGDEESTTSVDYPQSGDYLSSTGIHLLRQGFEVMKKNEVEEDLVTLIRERVNKAQSESAETLLYEQMLLATLQYWQDEKDDAVATFRTVAQQVKDDPQFQFDIASLYEKLGDHDEALNIIEAIEPRKQKLVQQKETKVLALAERLGDHDRARAAAERLFGLRLKTQTQLSLVSNMKRLGMVEMAEAVVSRAQRRGGQKIPAMVSLMGLYQGQGKTELAAQVAHRILQRTRSTVSQATVTNRSRRYSRRNSDDAHRKSAISTLQQTGNLAAVVDRLEKQQQRSPDSTSIYEKLIELYMHTGNSEKLIPILETAVEARPKSSYFREQLAKQYSSKGKNKEACQQYAAAIRENPSMLGNEYYEIMNFFKAANRSQDLLEVFQDINIREIGQPYYVARFAADLLKESQKAKTDGMSEEEKKASEANERAAIELAEKIFKEYPNYRRYVIRNFRGEKVWKNKRLFDLARRSIIPTKSQAKLDPWFGFNDISSHSGNGNVSSVFHDIFKGIEGTDQEQELCSSIEKHIELKPQWLAGKIMLAMFDVRDDREEKAKESLTKIFADEEVTKSIKGDTARLVAQELEKFSETRDLAIRLLEKSAKRTDRNGNSIKYTAIGKLVTIYADANENEKAKKLLLDAAKKKSHENYDRQYRMYERGETLIWIAEKLIEIDCPADAVSTMQGMLGNQEMLSAWSNYGGRGLEKLNKVYSKALQDALSQDEPANVAKALLAVRDNPRAGEGAFDLKVGIRMQTNDRNRRRYVTRNGVRVRVDDKESQEKKSQVECKIFNLLESLSKKDQSKQVLEERLNELVVAKPADKTIAIAQVWFHLKHSPEDAVAAAESLLKLVKEYPLDEIREGRRPNTRQRREAMQHVALWPISYKCLTSEDERIRAIGKELGQVAIEGAKLQSDKQYQQRMLFEWGEVAVKEKDLEEAEKKWGQLLDEVTRRPTRKKKPQPTGAAPAGNRIRPPATGMLPRLRWRAESTALINRRSLDSVASLAMCYPQFVAPWSVSAILQAPAAAAPRQDALPEKTETKTPKLIAPLTNSQFQTALQVAAAAADNGMVDLSKRAMREMLKGGLPVADPQFEGSGNDSRMAMVYTASNGKVTSGAGNATNAAGYGTQIVDILKVWEDTEGYEPAEVYEMVVGEIFPENRPQEILLYESSSSISYAKVSSLAQTVVSWAAKAGRLDDLKKRIAARESQPAAQVQALVLRGIIGIEEKDLAAIQQSLTKLVERANSQPVPRELVLACHVAVPAWSADDSLREQCIEIYRKKMATDKEPSLGKIATRVNRHLAANGGEEEVRQFIESYLAAQQTKYSRYGGDYGIRQMKQALYKVSEDLAEANMSELALEYIGRAEDIKTDRYGRSSTAKGWGKTAKRIRSLAAKERYAKLKEWTLPKPDRQTVRFASAWNAVANEELSDFRPKDRPLPTSSLPGLQNNFLDLIDAATEAGKMKDLKKAVAAVNAKRHPLIEALQTCVALRSKDSAAKGLVKKYIANQADRNKNEALDQTANQWCDHLVYRLGMQHSEEVSQLYDDHREKIIKQNVGGTGKIARREYEMVRSKTLGAKIKPGTIAQLNHWKSESHNTKSDSKVGSWVVCDDNQLTVLDASGPVNYWLNYPLAGKFRFSCEAYITSKRAAEISCGGAMVKDLAPKDSRFAMVSSVGGHEKILRRIQGSVEHGRYNKLAIEVADGVMKHFLNGKILYEEKLTGTYPWLKLFTSSSSTTAWRNAVLEGQPEIPSEIELVIGDRMEGWSTGTQSQIAFREMAEPKPKEPADKEEAKKEKKPEDYDWHAKEGVLYGKADPEAAEGSDSSASYRRPMSDGERLTFEFRYEPGKKMANPTLGSVIVGLTEGKKAHELYLGDAELKEDSTITNITQSPHAVEPVKLIANDWNTVEIRIVGANAEVVVNEATVWRRPIAKLNNLFPGVQKFKTLAAEIRNLRLQGDWPETLPEGLGANVFASKDTLDEKDRDLIAEVVGDQFISVELFELYEGEENEISAAQRYEQFRTWVLPGKGHGVRIDYRTMPKEFRTSQSLDSADDFEIQCPAWDMIMAAKETDKLRQLAEEIDKLQLPDDKAGNNFIGVAALKTMLAIAVENDQVARAQLGEIFSKVVAVEAEAKENKTDAGINRMNIAVPTWYATNRPDLLDCAASMQRKASSGLSSAILARIERLSDAAVSDSAGGALTQWNVVPTGNQSVRRRVSYVDKWQKASPGLLVRMAGLSKNPLYFQSPLKGKFEISADVSQRDGDQCWLDYGGYAIIAQEKNHRTRISANNKGSEIKGKRKVPSWHSIVRHRIVVDGNNLETYVNDVRVSRYEFDEAPQPWFTLRSKDNSGQPIVQNIRITGQPEIPNEIDLLAADRPQWSGTLKLSNEDSDDNGRYVDSSEGFSAYPRYGLGRDSWLLKEGELTAGYLTEESLESSGFEERWLYYKRPMLEDGEYEFEMFAEQKTKKLCHVAIGRTALLLKEDGVWRHEIGGNKESEEIADKKVADSKGVELKDGDWNRVLLQLQGDSATLLVNDQEVAKLAVADVASIRFPGLFRFADQSNAKVRNVKYRGSWPTELPPVEQQELAFNGEPLFAQSVAGQTTHYDLAKSIDDLKAAGLEVKGGSLIESTEQGLRVTARKNSDWNNWPSVSKAVSSNRDFDVSVDFADLRISNVTGWGCGLDLGVNFEDAENSAITVGIRRDKDNKLFVLVQRECDQPNYERRYDWVQLFEPFDEGTLRLVRQGGKIYALAAAKGQPQRVVGSFTVGQKMVSMFSVVAKSATDTSKLDAVVKKMSVRLDQ